MKVKHLYAVSCAALALLLFSGCPGDPAGEDSFAISEITIRNIPAAIPVHGRPELPAAPTYKVYVYASNFMSNQSRAEAKGVIAVTPEMLQSNGTYTVTIPLGRTNPIFKDDPEGREYDPNPNLLFGPWSGEANFFSLAISPADTSEHNQYSIWMKGNYDLNIEKTQWDWNSPMNFRLRTPGLSFDRREWEFFHDNICFDPDVHTHNDGNCQEDTSSPGSYIPETSN